MFKWRRGTYTIFPLCIINDFCIMCLSRIWSALLPTVSVYLLMGDDVHITLFSSINITPPPPMHPKTCSFLIPVSSVISHPFPYIDVVLSFHFSLIFYNWFSTHWKVVWIFQVFCSNSHCSVKLMYKLLTFHIILHF